MSSLVLQTSFLGDTVLTTPLIAELARRGPVDVVTTLAGAGILQNNPDIRTVIAYDKRGAGRGVRGFVRGFVRVARRLSHADGGPYEAAYLAQGSLRTAALARFAGVPVRVGFDTSAGRRLYTRRVPHRAGRHHAERLWSLAYPDDPSRRPEPGALRPRLYPGDDDVRAVDALLAGGDGRSLLALAPGSVWATKRWPYYPELARALAPRYRIAVVGSADDRPLARAIRDAAGTDVVDATGRLSLLASADLVRRATVLVTNDSLPQHLASAMGTRTITIFGPTVPAFGFGPLAPGSVSIGLQELACRPCHHHGPPSCPLRHWKCMRDLDADSVFGLVG